MYSHSDLFLKEKFLTFQYFSIGQPTRRQKDLWHILRSVNKENLVNMSYLREKAKEHHLKRVEYKTFLEEPGNMLSQYDTTDGENAKYAKEIRNTPAMMTWARMNAYFIFQKIRDD